MTHRQKGAWEEEHRHHGDSKKTIGVFHSKQIIHLTRFGLVYSFQAARPKKTSPKRLHCKASHDLPQSATEGFATCKAGIRGIPLLCRLVEKNHCSAVSFQALSRHFGKYHCSTATSQVI
jgi:hypothetical protein